MFIDSDRDTLRKASFACLKSEFKALESVLLHIDLDQNLIILCHQAEQSALLLEQVDLLQHRIYPVTGCWYASVWLMGDRLWAGPTNTRFTRRI